MEIIRFALLGLGSGAVYALLAQGLVLVYRGSGLLNLSQGAIAMFGAYAFYECSVRLGLPLGLSFIVAIVLCVALGALIHLGVLRRMGSSSPLTRIIATLGILTVLQAGASLLYGNYPFEVPSLLPTRTVHLFSSKLPVGLNTIMIFGVGLVATVGLTLLYRRTRFGKITAAVAESELVAASLGHSPDRIATANWALGSALAGVAGVLIVPIIYLEPASLVLLVIPALSAALIGNFTSFPITFLVALGLGIANSELTRYVSSPGWSTAAPFIAIVVYLVLRGRGLPLRSLVVDRLPSVGSGRIRAVPTAAVYAIAVVILCLLSESWASAVTATLAFAIICLSVVVVTGFAGQLSLAQAVLAGVGALAAARLDRHVPFVAALVLAVVVTAAVGALFGAPALRTRGVTLAIVTLGLGSAVVDVVFGNYHWTGGVSGIEARTPSLFGWDIDPYSHSSRYGVMVLTALALVAMAVANLRRGAVGRRLLAVRSNERAAAALGVNVSGSKLYAFTLGAAIAGLGGTLLAFQQSSVSINGSPAFAVLTSIVVVGAVVVYGVGWVSGGITASVMIGGGVITRIFHGTPSVNNYLPLVGGFLLLLTLVVAPDGVVDANRRMLERVVSGRGRVRPRGPHEAVELEPRGGPLGAPIEPRALSVRDLTVAFGGVRALDGVSIDARPGQVHGIIGPNGAGKTTLIDAITGFVRPSQGSVSVGGNDVTGWSPTRLARGGLSRSFQSLELFEDLSVIENIAVASDHPRPVRYLADLVHPGHVTLTPTALEAMRQLELGAIAQSKPNQISFGRRKTVAIARAIACGPSVLLLDEPAAGLDDHEAGELAQLIRTLADSWNLAIILVEHKVDMIMAISDHVTVLAGGQVLASGTPSEVSGNEAVHDAYLGGTPGTGESEMLAVADRP